MKKLFTLFALLVAIVTGAQADTEVFSMETKWKSQSVTQNGITVTFSDAIGNAQTGYYKFTKGNTMTISSTVGNITALAFTSDSEKYGKANGTTVNTGTLTGAGTANISWSGDASEVIFTNDASKGGDWRVASITVTYSSGSATQPSITQQPQNVTYIIGSEDSPSFTVAATASAGDLSYQWRVIDGTKDNAIQGATDATIVMKDYIPADLLTVPATYQVYCVVTDGNGSVESNKATLIIKNAAVPGVLESISASTTWNFSDITWDGESYKNNNGDFEFTGDNLTKEWIYGDIDGFTFASSFNASAIAFTGQYPIRNNSKKIAQNGVLHFNTTVPGTIKVSFSDTGKTIPEGGAVKRYLNVNGTNTEFYTMRDGSGTDPKTAEVEVAAGDVTITGMGEDGITPQAICVTSVEFTAKEVPAGPTITKQPAPATYIIGTTEYPSTSIEATVSEGGGSVKYQWHIILGSTDVTIPGATAATISTADYVSMLSDYLTQPATYDVYCVVTDYNGSVTSQKAAFTVKEGEVIAPTITKQPENATYIIGTTDYPSTSVEAQLSEGGGELKYEWHIILGSTDVTIPGATTATLNMADYAEMMAAYLSTPATYEVYCLVSDNNGTKMSDKATVTVKEEEVGPELDEQTDVTGDMTWDWSKFGTTEIKFLDDGTTTPKKPSTPPTADEEFVLSNVIAYGWCESIGADFGDAQALKVACEYPVRDGSYFQGPILRFNTTVPGTVKITCSSTGSKDNHNRDVIIGGVVAGQVTNTTMADFTAEVADGEVLIKGVSHGAGADADAQYLRISKIVFTAGTPTGVNGVAEAETEAPANVKIIKNGQLFIGKFNIAGQQVK